MKDKIRVGVIGTSFYSDFMHMSALKSHPQAAFVALCGRNRTRADEMARKHEVAQVFTDYHEMIEHGNLDAVIIAASDDQHYPMAMAALEAGLHVLCEKPLALNLAQAREMLVRAESAGVKTMAYFEHRWNPNIRYMLQLLGESYLGTCYHARFSYLGNYARGSGYQWKWDRQYGLGVLGDMGSHIIDMALLTIGDITRVQAHLATHIDRPASDGKPYARANDVAMLTLQFSNGAQGTIQTSAVAQVWESHISLTGDAGALDLDFSYGGPVVVRGARRDEGAFQILPVPENLMSTSASGASELEVMQRLFTGQPVGTRLFIDSIIEDKPISPSFRDGAKTQAVIEAALESDRTGCWADVQAV